MAWQGFWASLQPGRPLASAFIYTNHNVRWGFPVYYEMWSRWGSGSGFDTSRPLFLIFRDTIFSLIMHLRLGVPKQMRPCRLSLIFV